MDKVFAELQLMWDGTDKKRLEDLVTLLLNSKDKLMYKIKDNKNCFTYYLVLEQTYILILNN